MGKLPEEPRTKVTRAKIILEGVDDCKEGIGLLKKELKELNGDIRSVDNSMEQLVKSMQEFSRLFGQSEFIQK